MSPFPSPLAAGKVSPLSLASRVSPIDSDKLECKLLAHPEKARVPLVLSGLHEGFRIGFNPSPVSLKLSLQNIPSATLHPAVIDEYMYTELTKGRVAGPFPCLLCLRFTSVASESSRKSTSGENGALFWTFLARPSGHSINDGIPSLRTVHSPIHEGG